MSKCIYCVMSVNLALMVSIKSSSASVSLTLSLRSILSLSFTSGMVSSCCKICISFSCM